MQFDYPFQVTDDALSAAVDRLPDAVLIADDSRTFVYANAAACKLLALCTADLIGKRIEDIVPGDVREHVAGQWESFLQAGVQQGPFRVLAGDGSEREVDFTAVARIRPGMHITFLRDVTAQRIAERTRMESERLAKMALSAGRMGSWVWHSETGNVSWNETMERMFGLTNEWSLDTHSRLFAGGLSDHTYESFLSAIHPDDREYVRVRLGETARFGKEYDIEYRIVRRDGEIRWIANRGQALFNSVNKRIGLLGLCWDVTEAREAESQLRLSEVRFRTLLEQSPLSTQLFGPDGRAVLVNKAWTEFWGTPAENAIGYNIFEDQQLIDHGVMPKIERAFRGEPSELPIIPYFPPGGKFKGQEIWVRAFIYPVQDDEGHVQQIVVIHEDVTTGKRLEHERLKQAEELARSNSELQRFVYVASHDLKEPLRNMGAFSQLLRQRANDRLSPDEREYLTHIADGSKRMAALIDGLLDYSRASFQRDLVLVLADVNELLRQALENLAATILQTGAAIQAGPLPTIKCAPVNVVQLFQNLIGNAIKYAGPKRPAISISANEDEKHWTFSVQDSGIGIDPKFHEQIFGVFRRLHGREYAGTGIGLAICKAIVEKHCGNIWVESEAGQGAKFFFTLPK